MTRVPARRRTFARSLNRVVMGYRPRAFIVAVALLAVPADTEASLPLPDQRLFESLGATLEQPVSDLRWQCSPDGDRHCGCVEFNTPRGHLLLADVSRDAESFSAGRFAVSSGPALLTGTSLQARNRDGVLTVGWERARLTFANRDDVVDHGRGDLQYQDREVTVELAQLDWGSASDDALLSIESCDELRGLDLEADTTGRRATATGAESHDDRWSVRDLEISGPMDLAVTDELEANRPAAGWLPPSIRVAPSQARLTASYHLGEPPLAVRAHATTRGAGTGLAWRSTSPTCETDRTDCRHQPLALDVYADPSHSPSVHLGGQFAVGSPQHHFSAEADGLGVGLHHYDPAGLEQLEHNRSFRHWGRQRAGASMAGDRHDLTLDTALYHRGRGGFEIGDEYPVSRQLRVRYGTEIEVSERASAEFRAGHREFGVPEMAGGRISSTTVRWERPWGSMGRLYLRPALRGEASAAVVDSPDGAVAGSETNLDALLDGGLAIRGRFDGLTHRLAPRAFAGRRISGTTEMPPWIDEAGLAETVPVEEGGFNMAGLNVDQRLVAADRIAVELPAGVAVVDDGRGRHWRSVGHASLAVAPVTEGRSWRVGADGICIDDCERWGLQMRLDLDWSRHLKSTHLVGRGMAHRPGSPLVERRIRTGFADRFAPFGADRQTADRRLHASMLRGDWTDWRARFRWFGDPTTPSETAAQIGAGRFWSHLGWEISADLAVVPDRREWTAMIGLRNSPVF